MTLKNNLYYFQYSINNQDTIIDFSNPNGCVVIANSKQDTQTELQLKNQELIDNITTYKTLVKNNCSEEDILKIIKNIINIIDNTKLINYSSFCVYFQVLKFSYGSFKQIHDIDEKINIIKTILDYYINNRHTTYLSYGYSDQTLQVMSDNASSRRNSKTGIKKIEEIILPLNFIKPSNINEFKHIDKCYILPDKGDKILFNRILSEYKIDFKFHKSRDNKYPDMLFKCKNQIFILEHKLTNGAGGSQNAEINEIISFIGEEETNPNVSYISCLQGDYMRQLNPNTTQPKVKTQYNNIEKNLKTHTSNYFVNGNGLNQLITDINS